MIRGIDNKGAVVIGITRREIDGLLEGKRCCVETRPELGGGPHVCLWFAETDADLIARLGEIYPERAPTVIDYRSASLLAGRLALLLTLRRRALLGVVPRAEVG